MDIKGKICLVTGGAGGLGEATVRRLVTEGATVVVADLADERAQKLVDQLGAAVEYVRMDVTDEASVAATLTRAGELGELRTVVCAHGGPVASQRLVGRDGAPMPQELFDRTLRVYLSGTFNVMRQGAAAMAKLAPLDSGVRGGQREIAFVAGQMVSRFAELLDTPS